MSPVVWASPAAVVLRFSPSETAKTWKMISVAIKPMTTPTINSIRLKPREFVTRRAVRPLLPVELGARISCSR